MRRTLMLAVAMAVLVTACGPGAAALREEVDQARTDAGVSLADNSPYLEVRAWVESVGACARANGRTPAPNTFDGETSVAVTSVTGTSSDTDDDAAARAIFDGLSASEADVLAEHRWDRQGVATYRCPDDGLLYGTVVVSDFVAMPTSGRYVTPVFALGEIEQVAGVRYGTAPLCEPTGNDRILDLWLPSGDTLASRPTVVLVHGGGLERGNRYKFESAALNYAQRGFVAVSIDYRTCPSGIADEDQRMRASNAIEDGKEAIRFLRTNAGAYGIDPDRIAMVGSSAGGVISLGTALVDDTATSGGASSVSSRPTAVATTAGSLTRAIEDPGFAPDPPPIMMFRFEMDTISDPGDDRYLWPYAYQTCNEVHRLGGICDFIRLEGSGHVIGISPNQASYQRIGPFLYEHLELADAS